MLEFLVFLLLVVLAVFAAWRTGRRRRANGKPTDAADHIAGAGVGFFAGLIAFVPVFAVIDEIGVGDEKLDAGSVMGVALGGYAFMSVYGFVLNVLADRSHRSDELEAANAWARAKRNSRLIADYRRDIVAPGASTDAGIQIYQPRDYQAEVTRLLSDGTWRTTREIAAPKPKGVGTSLATIKHLLEQHPDVFESRTGDAAAEVGRSKQATVWQLRTRGSSRTRPVR